MKRESGIFFIENEVFIEFRLYTSSTFSENDIRKGTYLNLSYVFNSYILHIFYSIEVIILM